MTTPLKDSNGNTALHLMSIYGNTEPCGLLLHQVRERNNTGEIPLHIAAKRGHPGCVKICLNYDPTLAFEKDNNGDTALHLAAQHGNDMSAELLTANKKTIFEKNKLGQVPLHLAVEHKQLSIVKMLLESKNEKDNNGDTPLDFLKKINKNWTRHLYMCILAQLEKPDELEEAMAELQRWTNRVRAILVRRELSKRGITDI